MGTPEFGVASLDAMVKAGFKIVGVITAPDKPAGRGMQIQQSAVKKYSTENKLTVLQPEKLKDPLFIDQLRSLKADVQVVVAFRMLPEVIWNMPPLGTINLHGSLLPQYRGAAPINWAIINGEKFTGVTTFKLQHEIDTGNILLAEKIEIKDNETAGELHDKMKEIGATLIVKTIKGLADETIIDKPQGIQNSALQHAPKIFTETCEINWTKHVDDLYNLIRGLSPYPAAFTTLEEKKLKIYKASKENIFHDFEPGSMETDGKHFLKFACTDGFIHVLELQLEGKRRIDVEAFLRGYRFAS